MRAFVIGLLVDVDGRPPSPLGRSLEQRRLDLLIPTLPPPSEFADKEAYCSPGREKLGRNRGDTYRGCQSRTESGYECQKWTDQYPQTHTMTASKNPGKGLGEHNYCRNPYGQQSIWCYTTDELKRWEYCFPLQCGNGQLEPFNYEYCDDGNTDAGDGCSPTCEVEDGFVCVVDAGQAFPISRCKNCRNGIITGAEGCDDGNSDAYDGCSPYCEVEEGWKCKTTLANPEGPSVCQPDVCGDGLKWIGEKCDDGNLEDNDGCSGLCTIEPGFTCNQTDDGLSKCKNCGNSHMDLGETCDDGNEENGDGCSSECELEDGAAFVGPNGEVVGTKFTCKVAVSGTASADHAEETTATTTPTTTHGGLRQLAASANETVSSMRMVTRRTICSKVKSLLEEHKNSFIYYGGLGAVVVLAMCVGVLEYRKRQKTKLRLKKGEILIVGVDGQVKKVDTLMAILRIQAMIIARKKRKERERVEQEKADKQQAALAKTTAMLQEAKLAKAMRDMKSGSKYASGGPDEEGSSPSKAKASWGKAKSGVDAGFGRDFI